MSEAARSAALLTLVSVGNSVLSFVVDAAIAAQFGAGARLDAYFTAQVIPGILGGTLSGAVAVVFVPVFLLIRSQAGEARAWAATSGVLNLLLIALGGLSLPFFTFPHWFLARMAPGLSLETLDLAAKLFRWLLAAALFSGAASLLGGIHNSLRSFILPSLLPALLNVINLGFVLVAAPRVGIVALAAGALTGAVAQAVLLGRLLARGGRYKLGVSLADPHLRESARLAALLVIGGLAYNAFAISDRYFASFLPPGALTHLTYAARVGMFLSNLLSASVGTVAFTVLSGHAAAGRDDRLGIGVAKAASVVSLAVLPALATLLAVREPVLALLLERKSFTADAIRETARIMPYGVGAFAALAIGRPMNLALFAMRDTRTPLLLNLAVLFIYVPLTWTLTRSFGLGTAGIALASAIAHMLLLAGVTLSLRQRLAVFPIRQVLLYLRKLLVLSSALYLAARGIRQLTLAHGAWSPATMRLLLIGEAGTLYLLTMSGLYLSGDPAIRDALASLPLSRRGTR